MTRDVPRKQKTVVQDHRREKTRNRASRYQGRRARAPRGKLCTPPSPIAVVTDPSLQLSLMTAGCPLFTTCTCSILGCVHRWLCVDTLLLLYSQSFLFCSHVLTCGILVTCCQLIHYRCGLVLHHQCFA